LEPDPKCLRRLAAERVSKGFGVIEGKSRFHEVTLEKRLDRVFFLFYLTARHLSRSFEASAPS
jgi:hypothetical protein